MRVREVSLPVTNDKILGEGIDVTKLPEGHLSCPKCSKYKWECSVILDNHRLECGCVECGNSLRLLFPIDIDLVAPFHNKAGRFSCYRRKSGSFIHDKKAMIIIHNSGSICIGCEACNTQVVINVKKTESNLILPGGK